MYICECKTETETKTFLQMTDPTSRQRATHDYKDRSCQGYDKNLVMSPQGARHQDGRTD
jgi:hypothetical protein